MARSSSKRQGHIRRPRRIGLGIATSSELAGRCPSSDYLQRSIRDPFAKIPTHISYSKSVTSALIERPLARVGSTHVRHTDAVANLIREAAGVRRRAVNSITTPHSSRTASCRRLPPFTRVTTGTHSCLGFPPLRLTTPILDTAAKQQTQQSPKRIALTIRNDEKPEGNQQIRWIFL